MNDIGADAPPPPPKEQPAAEAPSGAGVGSAPAAPPTPEKIRERSASDELYGLDWSALGVDSAAKAPPAETSR